MKSAVVILVLACTALADPVTSPAFPGKCLEAWNPNGNVTRGANLRLAECNGSTAQDFQYDFDKKTLALTKLSPPLCIDLFGPDMNGVGVILDPCNGSGSQKWDYPSNQQLRPIAIDPNKCATHTTRPGKPATGWAFDTVVNPNCDGPSEQGGGGFCSIGLEFFFEMALFDCDRDKNEQRWQLPTKGKSSCEIGGTGADIWPLVLLALPVLRRRRQSG